MPSLPTRTMHRARDDAGRPHEVIATRMPVPGRPDLAGTLSVAWGLGIPLEVVNPVTGILRCTHTGKLLRIEDWHGVDAL